MGQALRRIEINWGARGRITYKCDSARFHESGHVLILFKVRSQDPGVMRVIADTKAIPLDGVLEIDDNEW